MNPDLVWITGAGGLIGSYLAKTAPHRTVVGLTRPVLDLTDYHQVRQRFAKDRPGLVVHCAALSRSPDCQANPAQAQKLNVEVTIRLAELAAEIPFFFFSTDLVFDGRRGNYDETAPVNPLSVYAETKVIAERFVMANPKHTVIRTSLNGGLSPTGDRGFNEQIRRAWERGQTLTLFTDEFRCPIAAATTASALWRLAGLEKPGLYHVAGGTRMSRWQIGMLLADRYLHLEPRITKGCAADYPGAPRPLDTSLNCSKIEQLLALRLPSLADWLSENPSEPF